MKYLHLFLILPLSLLPLSACTKVGAISSAVSEGGKAAAQEGGIQRVWTDTRIQAEINDLWFKESMDIFTKLDLTVNEGRVLITGVVQNPEHRVEAVRLAWQPKGVKQVINEVRVANSQGFSGFARDTWATTRLRTAITLDRKIQSINYNIDTVQGIVYLMGVAQNQAELNRVIETARTIPDVKEVVSYVRVIGDKAQTSAPVNGTQSGLAKSSPGMAPIMDDSDMSRGYEGEEPRPISLQPEPIQAQELEPAGWN